MLRALEAASARIESLERAQSESIAIVGLACRFPGGADNPEKFWRLLVDGADVVGELPDNRFDAVACRGGFLRDIDRFDADFFGISPREAESLDPQQRLLLETAWHACEDAGIPKARLNGSRTGVFVGVTTADYGYRIAESRERIDAYYATGTTLNMAAGRLSYWFGLRGPSLAVDTACSSSLVAVHYACQSLRSGECDAALAAGVNLIVRADGFIALSKAGALSTDGRCKPFDASADGMGRGEGCGVLVLKRLSDALAAGDRIAAVIRGSAVTQDGATAGLTVPNGPAQQDTIRRALAAARVEAADVDYVEAHGTGTPLGDPIEMGALGEVFGASRRASRPLLVGSVKANIAHLESAAGMASLVKTVLCLRHGQIPPQVHFHTPSPHIQWEQLPVRVATTAMDWRRSEHPRIAGISGFGFSGTNAHVVLEEAPVRENTESRPPDGLSVLTISAATRAALGDLVQRYVEWLPSAHGESFHEICRASAFCREHLAHRVAVVARSCEEAAEWLRAPDLNAPEDDDRVRDAASRYIRGESIDWEAVIGRPARPLSLPRYPFQRKRYWFAAAPEPAAVPMFDVAWVARPAAQTVRQQVEVVDAASGTFAEDVERAVARRGTQPLALALIVRPLRGDARESAAWDESLSRTVRIIELVKALAALGAPATTRLWIVTRGAQAAGEHAIDVLGASVWGLGRTIALEHPDLWGGLIDLDPGGPADISQAIAEIETGAPGHHDNRDDQVAYRGTRRLVPRLHAHAAADGASTRFPADASYLITGGTGGLGLSIAEWMIDAGARHLVLAGRRAPGETIARRLEELRHRGASVTFVRADVSDRAGVDALIRAADSVGELRGIIHASGQIADGVLLSQDRDTVGAAMQGKARGALHLDAATRNRTLDFFVMCSSLSGVLGSPGQGNYAAANALLDGLAADRRRCGLPALSISWGPWSGAGMASRLDAAAQAALSQRGVSWISPAQGLRVLDRFVSRGGRGGHVVAARFDATVVQRQLSTTRPTIVDDLASSALHAEAETTGTIAAPAPTATIDVTDRAALTAYLGRAVCDILRVDAVPSGASLQDIGLDSMMATEFRNRLMRELRVDIPISTFLADATLDTLADAVSRQSTPAGSRAAGPSTPPGTGPRERPRSVSFAQARLLSIEGLTGGRPVYHIPACARLDGPLDVAALQRAFAAVVSRHDVLRTTFSRGADEATQSVCDVEIPLVFLDRSGREDAEAAAARDIHALMRERFDLSTGPLVRAVVIRIAQDVHLFALNIHHIVADGWSMRVLLAELSSLYDAALSGQPSMLPALPVQYADFADWQRASLTGDRLEQLLSYWRGRLQGAPDLLELPADRGRRAVPTLEGGVERFVIDAALVASVRELAASRGATLFQTLLALMHALLHRYTGESSVVVGSPIANRTSPELEPLIGFFVNMLAHRADFDDDPEVGALIERVKTDTLDAYAHQELPFDALVADLAPSRSLSHHPIVQVVFALQNAPLRTRHIGRARVTQMPVDLGVSKFDLYFSLQELEDGRIAGECEYATDLFDRPTVERIVRHFTNLLRAAAHSPGERVSALQFLDDREARQVTAEWSGALDQASSLETVPELFAAVAAAMPDRVAVQWDGGVLHYGELARRAGSIAAALRGRGIGHGSLVGVLAGRTPDMVAALLGILQAGAAYVPLDPEEPAARHAHVVRETRVPLILTDTTGVDELAGVPLVPIGTLLDASVWHDPESVRLTAEDVAYVMYTSGSTGGPKGVRIAHRGIVRLVRAPNYVTLGPDDAVLQFAPIGFDASTFEIWGALLNGARLVLAPATPTLAELGALIRRERVTTAWLTASLFRVMVDEQLADLAGLRQLLAGGDVLSPPHVARAMTALGAGRVINGYGPTENTTFTCCHTVTSIDGAISIGRPIRGTTVYVLDERRRPVPVGVAGELYAGGAGLAIDYLDQPELTAARFVANPFGAGRLYRTGDRARWRSDGTLDFLGRLDALLKIRGFRVEPGEIEQLLGRHAAVRAAAVQPWRDGPTTRLVAYFVGAATPEDLRAYLAERLPAYMVPHAFIPLDALPLTRNGKVDRGALPPPAVTTSAVSDAGPSTESERTLCRIWSDVLRVGDVGVRDNFFELGGDSILAMQIVARSRAAGLKLTQPAIFQHQTIAELAASLERETVGPTPVDRVDTGEIPLSPIQEWFFASRPPHPNQFSQWALLDVPADLPPATLERGLAAVIGRHAAFRLRFALRDGVWVQSLVDRADTVAMDVRHSSGEVSAEAARVQSGFDLERGPLVGASRLGGQLLLVIHHLIVDAVSWRIICNDLIQACTDIAHARPIALSEPATSFPSWLRERARRPRRPSPAADTPRPFGGVAAGLVRDAQTRRGALDIAAMGDLRMAPEKVLLAALGSALEKWSGAAGQTIDVESHGRDRLAGVDVTDTVGWFTTIQPTPAPRSEPAIALFNYLGRIDAAVPTSAAGWALVEAGLSAAPDQPRSHRLAFVASIRGNRLIWDFEFAATCDTAESVELLARHFDESLAGLLRTEATLPLNPAQEGILFHAQLAGQPGLYVTQLRLDLDQDLPAELWQRAWADVAAQHPGLRTSFRRDSQHAYQRIVSRVASPAFEVLDWRGHGDHDDADSRLLAWLETDRARGFDISAAPPWRVTIVRTPHGRSSCVWTSHHAVVDGWSVAVVMRDLAASIERRMRGDMSVVVPEPIASDPASRPDSPAFWAAELAGLSEPAGIPLERKTGAPSTICGPVRRVLPADLYARVSTFARAQRLTPHTILQGAWALLLARCGDRRDVVFGEAVSGRASADIDHDAVGLFIRTIPVRIQVADDDRVGVWLQALQRRHLEREEHAALPLAAIQESCHLRGGALFDTLFVLENYPVDGTLRNAFAHVPVRHVEVVERPHYGFTLTATAAGSLALTAYYDASRLPQSSAIEILDRYLAVLEQLIDPAISRLGDLDLYGRNEARAVALARNPTSRPYKPGRTLLDLFEDQVARTPDAPALLAGDIVMSYGALDGWANRLGHELQARGVGADTLVGVSIERSPELVVALYGVLKAGGAYVAIDPAYPEERRAFMRRDAGFSIELDAAQVREACGVAARPDRDVRPDNLAYLLYTSGSTGTPKGALNTHAGIVNRLLWMQEAFGLVSTDVVLQKTPFSFDVSVWEFFWPLVTGASLAIAKPGGHLDRDYLIDAIDRHRVTTMHFVPSMLRVFLDAPAVGRCRTLRRVIVSGEALPQDLVDRFHSRLGAELHNLYGPTEAAVDVTWWPSPGDGSAQVSIGKAIANTSIHVVDRAGRLMPPGALGELCIGGVQVGRGYWNRPDLTAERFVPDPFGAGRMYRTGDVVRLLDDGNIEFLGRSDHQVKIRGVRVELEEVAAALRTLARVADAVVNVWDRGGDRVLVAYCAPADPAAPLSVDELRQHARAVLPDGFVPSFFVVLAELPRLPNGKVDGRALPIPGVQEEKAPVVGRGLSGVEEQIAALWRDVLGVAHVGLDDNFFDAGGHSLAMMRVHGRLQALYGDRLRLLDLFEHPTIRAVARFLARDERVLAPAAQDHGGGQDDIAIVGMACRFPGASSIDAFWENLVAGRESIARFSDDELLEAGEDPARLADERYVRAYGALDDPDGFDAPFFDMPPREATMVDPQQRMFLEVVWEALERAGCDASRCDAPIGVFAGAGINTYALQHLRASGGAMSTDEDLAWLMASDKDFLATRVSYKLNLRGPSLGVQTACSTSLVAVHLACSSLLRGDTAIAVAGGVTIRFPHTAGYVFEDGMIFSPDGHCRAFDARAAGVVGGSGAGVVVLKRLRDAIAAGDHIHAVIKATAINNDGGAKVGYTAPSIEGQVRVVAEAIERAGVSPDTIGYVEAHGTGTPVGDPIEVAALTRAWRTRTDRQAYCAIGSVKSNVGHLDAAAGVAGLIKTALALEHGVVPPTLNFESPNPHLEIDKSPFFVADRSSPWPERGGPRRAAVSSFGIGGTNAHAILEQAPVLASPPAPDGPYVLALSARTQTALSSSATRLADAIESGADVPLADAEHTLIDGRRRFAWRRAVVCSDRDEAIRQLRSTVPADLVAVEEDAQDRPVIFVFPGYGAQYPGMCRGLYDALPPFRADIDRCSEELRSHLPGDIRPVMFGDDAPALRQPMWAQPALFVIEYALARLWQRWGVEPVAMFGHSVGEYAAACVAGVFQERDALALVAARGRLIQETAPGAMLAIGLGESDLQPYLGPDLSVAVTLSPRHTIVAGSIDAIGRLERVAATSRIEARRVAVDRAMHSSLMDPAVAPLETLVARVQRRSPNVKLVSSSHGNWLSPAEAIDPGYWSRHLREPVRLCDALGVLLREYPNACVLEVGPGRTLAGPVARHEQRSPNHRVLTTVRHAGDPVDDGRLFKTTVAQLWTAGVRINTPREERRRSVPLPTYPFEHKRYALESSRSMTHAPAASARSSAPLLQLPTWERSTVLAIDSSATADARCLVFADAEGPGEAIAAELRRRGGHVIVARPGAMFGRDRAGDCTIRPAVKADYDTLLTLFDRGGPDVVVHAWMPALHGRTDPAAARDRGFESVLRLAQALAEQDSSAPCRLAVVTSGAHRVIGDESLDPIQATVLGVVRVLPQEHGRVACVHVDISAREMADPDLSRRIVSETLAAGGETVVAYRHGCRWIRRFSPLSTLSPGSHSTSVLRDGGAYLITGGDGGVGVEIAAAIAESCAAPHLVLVSRGSSPERAAAAVQRLEALGARVSVVAADVSDRDDLACALADAERMAGTLRGIVHAAGVPGGGALVLRSPETVAEEFAAKVSGTRNLHDLVKERPLDFLVLCSSTSAVTGGFGSAGYTAANAFQDAFAEGCAEPSLERPWVVAVNWHRWDGVGMAVEVERLHQELTGGQPERGLRTAEGRRAFLDVLAHHGVSRIAVCPFDLGELERATRRTVDSGAARRVRRVTHERSLTDVPFKPPSSETEKTLAAIWADVLGLDPIGADDPFQSLGGDSLLAIRMVARVRSELGVALPLRAIYELQTIAELAGRIETIRWAKAGHTAGSGSTGVDRGAL
jgi:amino acid adenylation domain-containing protein